MVRFTCPNCQSSLNAKDKLAGQSRKCPKCGTDVQIPQAVDEREPAGPSVHAGAVSEGLPRFDGPKRLTQGNRYLICDRARVLVVWSDGNGWMVKTSAGLVSVSRNPDLLPVEGSFTLVELCMERGDEGLLLTGVHCFKLATRWALTALQQDEHKILGKVRGPGSLNRDQKMAVLHFLKEQFMPAVWEGSRNVRDFLTNVDYASAGTE